MIQRMLRYRVNILYLLVTFRYSIPIHRTVMKHAPLIFTKLTLLFIYLRYGSSYPEVVSITYGDG